MQVFMILLNIACNMQNMQNICTICKICKRHFQYAEYAPPTLLMLVTDRRTAAQVEGRCDRVTVGRGRPRARTRPAVRTRKPLDHSESSSCQAEPAQRTVGTGSCCSRSAQWLIYVTESRAADGAEGPPSPSHIDAYICKIICTICY